MLTGEITTDNLRETCPSCNGTGLKPSPPTQPYPSIGQRNVYSSPEPCGNWMCVGGKIPTAIGRAIIKLCKDYDRPDKRVD